MTQMELEQQLGGLFGLLTVEFLVPYLNRKLSVFQKTGDIPRIPKGMVKPIIVAGINSLGRGQDVQALGSFLQTIAQTMGPEAITTYISKRYKKSNSKLPLHKQSRLQSKVHQLL